MSMQKLLDSATRTATTTSDNIYTTERANGLHVVIAMATITNTVTPKIQALDAYGNWYDILVGTAITSTGTTVLKVGPAIAPIAGASAQDIVPDVCRVIMTHSNSNNTVYTVAVNGGEI